MLFSTSFKGAVLALAASLSAVQAFEDTSPLMLLSKKMYAYRNPFLSPRLPSRAVSVCSCVFS